MSRGLPLEKICRRYKVELEVKPDVYRPMDSPPRGFCAGPRNAALNFKARKVVGYRSNGVGDILHEVMHIVCASKKEDIFYDDEGGGLLQLERAIGALMSKEDYRSVLEYQSVTIVEWAGACIKVRGNSTDEKQAWWKRGVNLAVRRGLLTPDAQPTWKCRRRAR